jgi:hypothetical protein
VGIRREGRVQRMPALKPIGIVAGIGAILFPVLNVLSLRYIDIEHEGGSNMIALGIFTLAYVSLLPLVFVLYQELSAASQPWSAIVAIFGAWPLMGIVLGAANLVSLAVAAFIMAAGLTLWIGLAGYLAFTSRLLPLVWALFSIAIAALAIVLAILAFVPALVVVVGVLGGIAILAAAIWSIWTGIMVLLRARVTSTSA